MSAPQYVIRFVGGPIPGERTYDEDTIGFIWPPPECIEVPGHSNDGCYHRISYSQIDKATANDYVIRGAEYEWRWPR